MHIDRSTIRLRQGFFATDRMTTTVVSIVILLSILYLAIFDLKHQSSIENLLDDGAFYYFLD